MPIYSILDILGWIVHGWWQRFVIEHNLWAGLAFTEPDDAPQMWLDIYPEWLWDHGLTNGKPDWYWCFHYTGCARVHFENWVFDKTDSARDTAVSWVRAFTGYVRYGYTRFEYWVDTIWNRVGAYSLWWADNLTAAADWLRNKLPDEIRSSWSTWSDIWEGIKDAVKDWARARFDAAVVWATDAWAWVIGTGNLLKSWWDTAAAWLDDFRQNAYERVTTWLGTTWTRAVTFFRDAGTFWYNLWGSYATEIGAFWADPLGWLYDRAEAELVRRW
jgi:hypothetical protein